MYEDVVVWTAGCAACVGAILFREARPVFEDARTVFDIGSPIPHLDLRVETRAGHDLSLFLVAVSGRIRDDGQSEAKREFDPCHHAISHSRGVTRLACDV